MSVLISISLVIAITGSAFALITPAFADANSVDALTDRWLRIEQQQQALQSQWRDEQAMLQQRLVLLQREAEQLRLSLRARKDNLDEVESEREALLARQNRLEAEQQQADQMSQRVTTQLERYAPLLPPSLQAHWQHTQGDSSEVSRQLQDVIDKLDSLLRSQGRVQVQNGRITLADGERLHVKQLYFGSQYAWFVTDDQSRAGVGLAQAGQWQWHVLPTIRSATIAQAIAMVEQRQLPDYLALPLHLEPAPESQQGG